MLMFTVCGRFNRCWEVVRKTTQVLVVGFYVGSLLILRASRSNLPRDLQVLSTESFSAGGREGANDMHVDRIRLPPVSLFCFSHDTVRTEFMKFSFRKPCWRQNRFNINTSMLEATVGPEAVPSTHEHPLTRHSPGSRQSHRGTVYIPVQ